jgi:hypothetical protein
MTPAPRCTVHACSRPVRELGGYCLGHWFDLSPLQRLALQEGAGEVAALPTFTGERRFVA